MAPNHQVCSNHPTLLLSFVVHMQCTTSTAQDYILTHVTRKQTLRALSLPYQKKDGCVAAPILLLVSFFWYDTDFSEFDSAVPNLTQDIKHFWWWRMGTPILLLVWQWQRPYGLFSRDTHHMLCTTNCILHHGAQWRPMSLSFVLIWRCRRWFCLNVIGYHLIYTLSAITEIVHNTMLSI